MTIEMCFGYYHNDPNFELKHNLCCCCYYQIDAITGNVAFGRGVSCKPGLPGKIDGSPNSMVQLSTEGFC
jgi:hypothetical protein